MKLTTVLLSRHLNQYYLLVINKRLSISKQEHVLFRYVWLMI